MPLDPFTALSVAAEVVQFVDFSITIVSKGHKLAMSRTSQLQEHEHMEAAAKRLRDATRRIDLLLTASPESDADRALKTICNGCKDVSNELSNELSKLKVPAGCNYRYWKSFRQGLKSVWGKSKLEAVNERLAELRQDLTIHVSDRRFSLLEQHVKQTMKEMLGVAQTVGGYAHHFNTSINSYLFTQSALEDKSQIQRLRDEKWQATSSTIMRNLRFASIHARLDAITTAHKKTFEWIFEEYNDYTRWLQSGTGMYWIQGKAAFGKSTLMHFIATHEKTMRNLRIWSGSSSLVVLRFYFWNSGDHEQRSLTGLLRSLLFEILAGHGSAIHYVFPSEWSEFYQYNIEPQPWRLPNLQKALTAAIRYLSSDFKICFFIDGLDEYEGDHVELTSLFKKLADDHDHIKFCVSSRPWTQFDEFASNAPHLMLQDLTKDDIEAYVVDNLGKNQKMLQLSDEDPDSVHELINEIVERASGVFLWVEIVVKSLMNGLRNSDDISRLQRRLQAVPKDLENLYEHMLKGIEDFYKEDASIVFEIFRMARIDPIPERSFNIPALYRVLEADFRTATSKKIEPRSEEEYAQIKRFKAYQGLEIWLRNCCKGLLEVDVVLEDDLEVVRNELRFPPIRYMHRTVKDYLEEIPVRQHLSSFIKDPTVGSNLSFLVSDIIELKEMSP
ncbi:uncharacterized protein K444DRAFT_532461, partial [Hyaloscypha bicolor E]